MNLNYVSYFSENSSSEKSKDAISQILEKINSFFTKLDVPSLTYIIPIVIIALFAISFVVGMWLRTKYIIAKIASVGLTIIFSITAATLMQNNERFKEYKDVIPFVITFAALLFYWLLRGIFFSITLSIHFWMRKRRKRIDKQKGFVTKTTMRLITGASNMIASSFGIFLFSNVLLSASQKDNSTSKASQVAVKIMTGGKGASLNGIGNFAISVYQVLTSGEQLFNDYINNPDNKDAKEKFEKVMEGFTETLNDPKLRKIVLNNLDKIPQLKQMNVIDDETATKVRAKVTSDDPRYVTASKDEKKEIATQYFVDNISQIYDEYIKDSLDNKTKSILGNFSTNLTTEAKEQLSSKISQIIEKNIQREENKIINFDKVINSLFSELEKREKQKDNSSEKIENENPKSNNKESENSGILKSI
ncbi:hypothetical protein [Mycoplasma sp. CSL10166]|uniref:hypothetical protein n=1 Tax=Mycoplasma sp. CSL10166 TaxID=2813825 RepID=UPI00197C4795|nr:hypothetical protein [Mycoplasma sp. CSL10166]MBN4084111.1 hypothetical protein [Mycoplasma sp. CSL10166]